MKKKLLLLFNLVDYRSEAPRNILRWCSVDESGLYDDEEGWLGRNKGLKRFDVDDCDLWRLKTSGGGGYKGLILDPSLSSPAAAFDFTECRTLLGCEIGLVDSTLVIVGGFKRQKRFAYLDTKSPDGKWIEIDMCNERVYPLWVVSHAAAGKLYIFGKPGICANEDDYFESWPHPEVFDSKNKTLGPLPGKVLGKDLVPDDDFYFFPKQVAALGHFLITFSLLPFPRRSLVLLYDTRDATWSYFPDAGPVFPPEFSEMADYSNLLTVGGDTIYWFSPESFCLHAYQFKFAQKRRFKVSQLISEPVDFGLSEDYHDIASQVSLFSLSPQLLCLVWHEQSNTNPSFRPHSICRISKLHIDKVKNGCKESLSVSLRSTHTCALPYSMLVHRVLLMEN